MYTKENSECPVKGLICPFCGGQKFTGHENTDYQATALYCDSCPAGMEDCEKTLAELIGLWTNYGERNSQ